MAHVVLVLVVGGGEEEREGTETVVVAVERDGLRGWGGDWEGG